MVFVYILAIADIIGFCREMIVPKNAHLFPNGPVLVDQVAYPPFFE